MSRRLRLSLIWAVMVGYSSCFLPAYDVTPDAKPLVEIFQVRYRAAHTLQATFLERSRRLFQRLNG